MPTDTSPARRPMLIDGEHVDGIEGRTLLTHDPATEEVLAEVAVADRVDVDLAVTAARRAFDTGPWPTMDPTMRSRILLRIADLIEEHLEDLAIEEVRDNGKPIERARSDVSFGAETFRYYAGATTRLFGQVIPSGPDRHVYVRHEPLGVCGQILPWNFPFLIASWKLAPALAAGNTVVLKPAEQTPLTALRLGELIHQAGVPDGVCNIVIGDGTTGAAIVDHPGVDKIAFTGSTEVGQTVMERAAKRIARVSLELGGKSPNIILPDADLDSAIPWSIRGVFAHSGQMCTAGSRLLVHRDHHDDVVGRLVDAASEVKVGPGLQGGVMIGPLVSQDQLERVSRYVGVGVDDGASVAHGGNVVERTGWFHEPTVLVDVLNDMRVAQEEIFGPVLSVIPFTDLDDAVSIANGTQYGLAAAVWTRDLRAAHSMAARIKAGTVWVNGYNQLSPTVPFGGVKASGLGRELGDAGIEEYTERKSTVMILE